MIFKHIKSHLTVSLIGLVITSVFVLSAYNSNEQISVKSSVFQKPNIVLLVTDDQGYGDLGRNNNPIIQTPNIDAFAEQSARLENFHVDPTCSPTRSALLTGKGSLKAGVWHTILGRYMLGPEHELLSEVLQKNGYETAIFGKWHLGDNYPYRPQDQGFEKVFIHGGGGVGQTPDYWGNTQFDDTYYRNGVPEKTTGYATTVWFDNAIDFIKQKHDKPYFSYIALNAPHGPYRAPEEFITPYLNKGLDRTTASFYGMITHIDGQVKRLRDEIKKSGQEDNTIFIFMTDNGSSFKPSNTNNTLDTKKHGDLASLKAANPDWLFNGGMRGYKGDVYEGGHRVPFYIYYPNGKIKAADYTTLTAHYDIMPTLLELAGIDYNIKNGDGNSLATLLTTGQDPSLNERDVVVTNQRVFDPSAKRPTTVAYKDWRYIEFNNKHFLYNLKSDPGQQNDIAAQHPEIAAQLKAKKQAWWNENVKLGFKDRYIHVGNPAENPVRLNAMDWMEVPDKQPVPWFIGHQAPVEEVSYTYWLTDEDNYHALPWYIDVEQAGNYEIKAYYYDIPAGQPVMKKYCVVEIGGQKIVQTVWGRSSHCVVNTKLKIGKQKVTAWFTDDKENLSAEKAAFYVYLEKLDK